MQYDFTTRPDRAGHDALAIDGLGRLPGVPKTPREGFPVIPMWVADMNFVCFPGIQEKVTERVNHPSFGYFMTRDEYYDGIIRWQRERNGVTDLDRKAIGYENGVLGGVISAMNVLCSKGDAVLLHSPTYIGFTGSLTNNGYHIVHSPLVFDKDGIRRMDFADMAAKVEEHHIHTVIFCSPHNPGGRVWEMEELLEFSAFCVLCEAWAIFKLWLDLHIGLQILVPIAVTCVSESRDALEDDKGVVPHVAEVEIPSFLPFCPPVPVIPTVPIIIIVFRFLTPRADGEQKQQRQQQRKRPFHGHPSFFHAIHIDKRRSAFVSFRYCFL